MNSERLEVALTGARHNSKLSEGFFEIERRERDSR